MQALLGASQPTVSRALAPLIQSGQVQKVGAARSQRYVLPRTVHGVGREVPMVRVDALGQPSPFARLVQLGTDPRHWNDDDVLRVLALFGDDLPGNLIRGRGGVPALSHPA